MSDGDVVLLENLRFNPGETAKNDEERAEFADALAGLADAYVSDGFGVVHRKQASVYDVAHAAPRPPWAGSSRTEVEVLQRLTEDPERPYAVVLGGAKVADKLAVIDNLMRHRRPAPHRRRHALHLPRGPGPRDRQEPASTPSSVDAVPGYLDRAEETGVEIVLPVDVVCGREFSADTETVTVAADAIPADLIGLDIGPRSAELYAEKLADTRTVFWNGPMGAFEMAPFAAGTRRLAEALVEVTAKGALTVVGGGDSAAAVRQLGFRDDQFGHISTGGGASLEYLEGKELPGIAILTKEH